MALDAKASHCLNSRKCSRVQQPAVNKSVRCCCCCFTATVFDSSGVGCVLFCESKGFWSLGKLCVGIAAWWWWWWYEGNTFFACKCNRNAKKAVHSRREASFPGGGIAIILSSCRNCSSTPRWAKIICNLILVSFCPCLVQGKTLLLMIRLHAGNLICWGYWTLIKYGKLSKQSRC